MASLPWRGLGLSTNLGAHDLPNPFRLRERDPSLFDFIEYSAPLSYDEAAKDAALFGALHESGLPALFHPVHLNLYGPEPESDERLAQLNDHLARIDSPWVGNDVGWWHQAGTAFPGYLYFAPPMTDAGLADSAAHALRVQSRLERPLLLENPAVSSKSGPLHVLDFMAQLHHRTGLGLILDLGHLFAHQLALGLPLRAGLDNFPFAAVIEIHLAGGVVTKRGARSFYVDDHTQPVREELFELLRDVLPRCTKLRAVTFEGDGHPEHVAVQTLQRLRELVPSKRETEVTLPARKGGGAAGPYLPQTRPWELFDAAYGERGPIADEEGARADTDFRLAVVAERLDRDFPLIRPLLAGTRAGLLSFTGSSEFRSYFDGTNRALPQVFASWARAVLRTRREPALDGVLAFEMWAQHELSHAPTAAPPPGCIGLAPGVKVARFARDFEELLFARESLFRHLGGRALASGLFEQSALDSLLQVARRSPARMWTVALRRGPAGIEAHGVSDELSNLLKAIGPGQPWTTVAGSGFSRRALEAALQSGLLAVSAPQA